MQTQQPHPLRVVLGYNFTAMLRQALVLLTVLLLCASCATMGRPKGRKGGGGGAKKSGGGCNCPTFGQANKSTSICYSHPC